MSNPLWVSFLAGSSTGMSVTLTLQPLDVIKTNIIGSQSAESRKMVTPVEISSFVEFFSFFFPHFSQREKMLFQISFCFIQDASSFSCIKSKLVWEKIWITARQTLLLMTRIIFALFLKSIIVKKMPKSSLNANLLQFSGKWNKDFSKNFH